MNLLKDEYSEEPGACHGHRRPGVGTDKVFHRLLYDSSHLIKAVASN